jgi:hypothetical protein
MRRSRRFRMESLISENKRELLNNKDSLEKIEKKVEEKRLRRA